MARLSHWSCLSLLAIACHSAAAPKFISEHKGQGSPIPLAYQQYQLDNGLTILLAPDHSDPLVHVDVTYHVGSAREELGKSGFAHFFEHMMFQGSQHVGDQAHMRLIQEAGGTMNGSTNKDRTNYYQTVPSNQLEKILWLEADRMGFLLPGLSQKKFEIQRATVKNERAQQYENRPYGLLGERLNEALYPLNHPYSWQTIGYVSDLDRVQVDDLKAFFQQWYAPNNATLTIGGDIDIQQTLQWIEKYFGKIPAGKPLPEPQPQPAQLSADRAITLEDDKIHLPLLYLSYPTVYLGHEDEPALDLLADILGGSVSSMLHQALVTTGKAVEAGAYHQCEELACSFTVYAYPQPDKSAELAPLLADINQVIADFKTRGVRSSDLEKARNSYRAHAIWNLGSVEGKVSSLAAGQVLTQDPLYQLKALEAIGKAKPQHVQAVYDKFIAGKPKVMVSVVPKGKSQWQATAPNFTPPQRNLPPYQAAHYEAQPNIVDSFDRSLIPAPSVPKSPELPKYTTTELAQGIRLLTSTQQEIPATSLIITLPGGIRTEGTQYGLASLTAEMMRQGTRRLNEQQFSDALQQLGASIDISAGHYATVIQVNALQDKLAPTLALLEELYLTPGFREEDFAKVKAQWMQMLQQRQQEPTWQANQGFKQLIYGSPSRLSMPTEGTLASLDALTLADVKNYYQRYYHPAKANLVAVGDVTADRLIPGLSFLQRWKGKAPKLPHLKPTAPQAKPGIYLIHQANAPQSVIRMGRRAMPFDATGAYFKANLANFNLGGNFNSRLNLNLREDKGYTYGISAQFNGFKDTGHFTIGTSVRQNTTASALKEIIGELTRYQAGMTAPEALYLKQAISQQEALAYETYDQKAGFLLQLLTYDLKPSFIATQQRLIERSTLGNLHPVIKQWLNPKDMVIVVVGDRTTLEAPLRALGYPLYPLTLNTL